MISFFFLTETNATEDIDDELKSFEKDTGPPPGIEKRDNTNDDVGKTITVERMERGRVSCPLHPLCNKYSVWAYYYVKFSIFSIVLQFSVSLISLK